MKIETAGQQKYYNFIEDRVKKLTTTRIVWVSLMCIALICSFSNMTIAAVIGVAGALLAVVNTRSIKALDSKLEKLPDQKDFFRQMTAPRNLELPEAHIIVMKDYILVTKTEVMILPLLDMEKMEVEMSDDEQKTLFLIDKVGKRHEIISTRDGMQVEFDKVYHRLEKNIEK